MHIKNQKAHAYSEVLRQEISKWIIVNSNSRSLITVTSINLAKGSKDAEVLVSVLPEDQAEFVVKFLTRKVRELQKHLQKRIRHRRLPFLKFTHDKSEILREKLYKLEVAEGRSGVINASDNKLADKQKLA